MTPHVHADLIKAWADGAEIEYFDSYEKRWLPTSGGPAWSPDRKYRIKDLAKSEPEPALTSFYACGGDKEESPLERLRFFCSLAMTGQDWLDVEPFFDALAVEEDL